jgi:DinB superfamily
LKKKKAVAQKSSKKSAVGKTANGKSSSANDVSLRKHLIDLLKGGSAHVQFMDALEEFPASKRGTFAPGLPHTGWQLLEHSRIAQWDILEFSRNSKHVSPGFPEGYWPKTPGPASEAEWDKSVQQFQNDLNEMIELVKNPRTDLFAKIPHGESQTILREALVLADHNAYHLGQLVDLRRALGTWPQS